RSRSLRARGDPEDRVAGGDLQQLLLGRVGTDAVEEHPDLELPAPHVRAQQLRLLLVGQLGGGERLHAPTDPQLAAARRAHVTHPLRVAARRDQVPLALEREQVHRGAAPLPALAAAHVQDAAPPDADPEPGQRGHRLIEQAAHQPADGGGRDHVPAVGAACWFWTDRHRKLLWLIVSSALYIEQCADSPGSMSRAMLLLLIAALKAGTLA